MKRTAWLGALLFSLGLGMGCGGLDTGQATSEILVAAGSDLNGEQFALADGNGPGARDKAGRAAASELDRLQQLLALSDEQVAQIQPILDATRTALEDVRAQVKAGTLSEADAHAKVKALHEDQKAQILVLLTPEQQAKWSDMRAHHCGPFDIKRLAEVLGLSAEQVSQIEAISSDAQKQVNEIHAQVEAGTLSREEAREQLEQVHQATKSAIDGVLTEEQKKQLHEILGRKGKRGGPGRGPGRGPGDGPPKPPGGDGRGGHK